MTDHGAPQDGAPQDNTLTPERIERIIRHMNEDHASSVIAYCAAFGDEPNASEARIAALDPRGFHVEAVTPDGPKTLRFEFEREMADAVEVRDALIQMAKDATPA